MLLEFWFLPFYLMAIFAQHNDIAMISPTLKRPLTIWIFLFLSLNLPVTLIKSNYYHLNAQESKPESSSWSEDPLGRQTPRGTASGFINAVADKNYQKAEAYLNFEAVENPEDHIAIVKTLESLLNQNGYLYPYSSISSDNTGKANDGLPPSIDRVGMLSINGEEMDLTVEKIEGNERAPIWLFSKNTVKLLQEIDIRSTNTSGTIEALLPSFLKRWSYGGAVIGHWIAMLLIGILSYLIAWAVVFITDKIIKVFWKSANEEPVSNILKVIAFPVQLFLAVWLLVYASNQLGISIVVRQKFSWLPVICSIIALSLILWRVTQFLTDFSQKKMNLRGNVSGVSVILFLNRAAKIAIVVFGIIAILDAVGVDVTTGLAALGIGGIALALGAQKTVENFVGSVTVIADQPVRVGDFCKVGNTIGTIENIGMRSTRIRTLNRTIVTIPNGQFSSSEIENYAHRDRFRFYHVFELRYETTPDQIRYLLVELRKILYAHPKVNPDPARVRFTTLAAHSINIEIFAFIMVPEYNDFLEVQEDILLRMMDVVETSGSGFAFPSQTVYLSRDKGLSKEKSEEAAKTVEDWKIKNDLQIPKFTSEKIEELKDSLTYPPAGTSHTSDN